MSLSNKTSLDTHTPTSTNNFGVEVAQLVEQRTENPEARHELVSKFLQSRRQGLSPRTTEFYKGYLNRAIPEIPYSAVMAVNTLTLGHYEPSVTGYIPKSLASVSIHKTI